MRVGRRVHARIIAGVVGWLAVGVLPSAEPVQAAPRTPAECRAAAPRDDVLDRVEARGELVLASGARAVLSGLRWPAEAEASTSAAAWLLRHRGSRLRLVARGEGDRWGRSRVDATPEGDAVDLAAGLIEAGLAHADAGESDVLCRPSLLSLEAGARAAGRGVWQAPSREAADGPFLRTQAGRFVVTEGRVLNVGERARRTYLDFARRGGDGLTVTVSKRTWRLLGERGLSAIALKGRRVRVRGVIELWRGPTLDIASADMIEILDEEQALRR